MKINEETKIGAVAVEDVKHTLIRCSDEIKFLRTRIAELEPRAMAYDHISIVLGFIPRQSQPFGEDIAWRAEKLIRQLGEPAPTEANGV